jgi:translocation and assembly module TamA
MSWRALARAARWLPLAAALGGCANLPFFGSGDREAGATAPGSAASAASAPSGVTGYRLEVTAPAPLDALLRADLDLARFEKAPETEGITTVELDRLIAVAPAQARSLLETEGYFNARVDARRDDDSAPPVVRIAVEPGPRTLVLALDFEASGALSARADTGDRAAADELALLRRTFGLQPGQPFRQAAWNDAKNNTLAQVRARGYPAASWSRTAAQIDADANTARLALALASGPLFRLGPIAVDGVERYDVDAVRRLAPFHPGDPYSEKALLDYQERLVKSGLFEGASVELDADPEHAAEAPIRVKVKELTLQQATVGIGYSANTGPRITLDHYHRRVFGQRWIAHSKFELGPDLKSFGTELTSYPLEGQYRNLVAANGERLRSANELRTSWTARIGRTQDTTRIERLYYLEAVHARVDSASLVTNSDALSANYNWVLRDVDNVVLPTNGITLNAQGALGYGKGSQFEPGPGLETDSRGPFVRTYGRLTWYRPLGSWYGLVRVEAGQVFAQSRIGVPDPLLFRAGGDDSVRGYGYRTLGPSVNNAVASGRVLATASAEIAHPISARLPSVWGAAFIDAGNAADRWNELHPVFGYGVGVRWRSPVGPLRVDLAYGEAVRQFRLHVSVGIAF